MTEERRPLSSKERKGLFWTKMALGIRQGLKMHQISEQMTKTLGTQERPWGNVTKHCLVQAARAEALGKWIGLPEDLIMDMKLGAVLHDFSKRQEITATREANQNGNSPLAAARKIQAESKQKLIVVGFDERVIRLAGASGGDAPVLIEVQRILDQSTLSDDDWAYLIVHYVDDCSIGDDWVIHSHVNAERRKVNIIDYRAEESKAKADYEIIAQEIGEQLINSSFKGVNNIDAMTIVSHGIEKRLAQRIKEKTEEDIDSLTIPELVDQKIKEAIENYREITQRVPS